MSENFLILVDFISSFGQGLLIFLAIVLLVLIGVVAYITYTEKKNSAWLSQRKSTVNSRYEQTGRLVYFRRTNCRC